MKPKNLILATSVLALVAISGQAFASSRTAEHRHRVTQPTLSSVEAAQQPEYAPEYAYDWVAPWQIYENNQHRYEGGPKTDY